MLAIQGNTCQVAGNSLYSAHWWLIILILSNIVTLQCEEVNVYILCDLGYDNSRRRGLHVNET